MPRKSKAPKTALGAWVLDVRGSLSQEEFGHRVGVHRVTVSNWERGAYPPSQPELSAILKEFPGAKEPPLRPEADLSDPRGLLRGRSSNTGGSMSPEAQILARELDIAVSPPERLRVMQRLLEELHKETRKRPRIPAAE